MRTLQTLLILVIVSVSALAEPGGIYQAAWNDDGSQFVTIGPKRRLRVHDAASGKVLRATSVPGEATTWVSFSPDSGWEEENSLVALSVSGDTAVVGSRDTGISWWSLKNLEQLGQSSSTYALGGFEFAGGLLAYTSSSTRYLDAEMCWKKLTAEGVVGSSLPDLPPPDSSSSYGPPSVSPEGDWILAPTDEGLRLWDMRRDPVTSRLLPVEGASNWTLGSERIYFLKNDQLIGYRYDDFEVEPRRMNCPDASALQVNRAETQLVTQNATALTVWDLTTGAATSVWPRKDQPLLLVSPNGRRGLELDQEWLAVWDIPSQTRLFRLKSNSRKLR